MRRSATSSALGASSVPAHPPVGEQHDTVGVCRRHWVVGDHHYGVPGLAGDLAEQGEHLVPGTGVQRPGWLVGEHHLGAGDQCPGDRDPLLLAAGQL